MRKKPKISVAFYDRLLTYLAIKRLNPIVTELFIRGRTQNNIILLYQKILDEVLDIISYENSKQTKASTNWNLSFIRYWL